MENGCKEGEMSPHRSVSAVGSHRRGFGRGRGFVQPTLADYQHLIDSIARSERIRTEMSSEEEKALINVGKGRGRLRNRENFRPTVSIQEQCHNVLGNSHKDVLLTTLVPKSSKDWFSDGNSVYSSPKKPSRVAGRPSRSDAEVYYSRYNDSDSFDDTPSSTVTSSSTGRNDSEPIRIGDLELFEKAEVEVRSSVANEFRNAQSVARSDNTEVETVIYVDKVEESFKDGVVLDQNQPTVQKTEKNDVDVNNANVIAVINNNLATRSKNENVVKDDVVIDVTEPGIGESEVIISKSNDMFEKTVKNDVEIDNSNVINNNGGGARSKNNNAVIAKTVKSDVRNDQNDSQSMKTDARFSEGTDRVDITGNGGSKIGKNNVTIHTYVKANGKNDDKVKKNGGAIKKTNKNDIRIGNTSKAQEKSDLQSSKEVRAILKDFSQPLKNEDVIDDWWDIDTVSEKSYDKSEKIPERGFPTSKPSSILPLSTFALPAKSNESVYGNFETAYFSNVRAFDAFGKQKRNTFPRFSIERDFPVLGANTATNTAIRPPSPVVRINEQHKEPKKKSKQATKPVANNKLPSKVVKEEPVRDSNLRPGSVLIRNLPKEVTVGSLRDMLDAFGTIEAVVLSPSDLDQTAEITFSDHIVCGWVQEILNDSPVPASDNILSVTICEEGRD